jgi:hypothetical protein
VGPALIEKVRVGQEIEWFAVQFEKVFVHERSITLVLSSVMTGAYNSAGSVSGASFTRLLYANKARIKPKSAAVRPAFLVVRSVNNVPFNCHCEAALSPKQSLFDCSV